MTEVPSHAYDNEYSVTPHPPGLEKRKNYDRNHEIDTVEEAYQEEDTESDCQTQHGPSDCVRDNVNYFI